MSLRLILIRHAKSSWDDPLANDHARVLNDRGRRSADAIGAWLSERGHRPDAVLCSDAARTRETWERISAALGSDARVSYLSALYHASPDLMLAQLAKASAPVVAMIGHNPGIGSLACGIVAAPPAHPAYGRYPTCATAIIEFPAERWSAVRPGTGQVVDFVVPRELTD